MTSSSPNSTTDFFISYNAADAAWAEWIAWQLEAAGYTVKFQGWDFRPGHNFVLEMQSAARQAAVTVPVLSPNFLRSSFTQPEWAAAFQQDPKGTGRKVLPVRIEACNPDGLLASIVWIDLVGLAQHAATTKLLEGVRPGRAKPLVAPAFPGSVSTQAPPFPATLAKRVPLPPLKQGLTDRERAEFVATAFQEARSFMAHATVVLQRERPGYDGVVDDIDARKFEVSIYRNGALQVRCRIWRDGEDIKFADRTTTALSDGAFNDWLHIEVEPKFGLRPLMSDLSVSDAPLLQAEDVGEYFWRRLFWRLQ